MTILNKKNLFPLSVAATLSMSLFAGIASGQQAEPRGFVYTMTNATSGNKVVVYTRDLLGRLSRPTAYDTNGTGTGTSLGNQSALILDQANSCLYAVNAGSSEITSFAVQPQGLAFADKKSSGGLRPISLTTHRNYLYVLNAGGRAGGADNITGFTVDRDCKMTPIANSVRPLSAANTDPAQIQFSPGGKLLVVTEKATNKIDTYVVLDNGTTTDQRVVQSAGNTPFGLYFGRRHQLFVSEANGGTANGGSLSSYRLLSTGDLQRISSAVPTNQTATCWVVVSNDGRFAYVTNTGSESLSTFGINFAGKLNLLNRNGIAGQTGSGTTPIDLSLSNDGLNVYALDNRVGSIAAFRVNPVIGSLNRIQIVGGLPTGANGLATR